MWEHFSDPHTSRQHEKHDALPSWLSSLHLAMFTRRPIVICFLIKLRTLWSFISAHPILHKSVFAVDPLKIDAAARSRICFNHLPPPQPVNFHHNLTQNPFGHATLKRSRINNVIQLKCLQKEVVHNSVTSRLCIIQHRVMVDSGSCQSDVPVHGAKPPAELTTKWLK